MRSRKPRPSTELTAQAVEPMATPATQATARAYQAVASAISPAVFPTEQWRQDTKDAMLREFRRPRGQAREDAGSLDGTELVANVVRVETGAGVVTLADMESISDDRAAAAAETVARIIAQHDDRSRLS